MPAVQLFGRKWRVSSDFLPVFAGIGIVFHSIWVVFIIIWPFGITNVDRCNNTKAGRHFLAAVSLFFILYVLSFIQELLITLIGLRGTPLETSKRKWMYPVLYTQTFNWIGQLGVVGYGTYVTHRYSGGTFISECSDASVVMLKVLVYSSWAMTAFNWGRLVLICSLFPDYERIDSWAKRIRFYTWYSRSKNVVTHLEKHQRRPLGRLAELYSRLLHGADLSPSDEFISLILLSAAQRKSRQEHIRRALIKYREEMPGAQQIADKTGSHSDKAPPPPSSHAPSRHPSTTHPHSDRHHSHHSQSATEGQKMNGKHHQHQHRNLNGSIHATDLNNPEERMDEAMADTLSRIHTPNAADDRGLTGSPDRSTHGTPAASHAVSQGHHVIDMPNGQHQNQSPASNSASSVHSNSQAPTKTQRRSQPASARKADAQHMREMEEGHCGTDNQIDPAKDKQQQQHSRQSSRRRLNQDTFFQRDFMLSPSSYACEYDPDIPPDKLADIYTGHKERVSRPAVTEAARFAKYAIAAYGAAGFQYLHQTSKSKNTYNLLKNRGRNAYKANKLMASKIMTLEQHLDYEAIIQIAEIEDQDLLYLNFDNQALGDLPYMLALDRPTKSVVLSIRGTVSVADLATDMLADPEPMEEWLPDTFTQDEEECIEQGPRRAHAGIMAAATAIWKDLRGHRILPSLLNISDSEDDDNPEYDIGADGQDGFDEAYGPDDDPAPMPEDQRLPAPHEHPGPHHKDEPVAPVDQGFHEHSPKHPSLRSPRGKPKPQQQKSNPLMMVGKGLHAWVETLQDVPQQTIGHILGGGHRSAKQLKRQLLAERSAGAAGNTPPKSPGGIARSSGRKRRHRIRNQNAASESQQPGQDSASHESAALHESAAGVNHQSSADESSDLRGWDKVRKVVRGAATNPGNPSGSSSSMEGAAAAALSSTSTPPEEEMKEAERELKRSSTSGGSLSRNTTGPMQYLYSRGGKMAAALALMAGRGAKDSSKEAEEQQHLDRQAGNASRHLDRHKITSSGASNAPGNDRVSEYGAKNPEKAVGRKVSVSEEDETEESKDSATRNEYASEIIMRGLNKEGWKLVITGHSLGAGAAALIALKLKDRFPEVKCWAYCPPGGLLTPNMAHAMKPFCTSVVVNKDCIPRMSLKNLNRFMEGKLMALACSRLNAFQIFWGSYGKVNRRRFFDKDLFRTLDEMPQEARQMLERFQECTLTDVSAQDMVPPGRVMYLRRFKASPNASPLKQEQHRRRAHSFLPKTPNSSLAGLKRLTSSDSDSSGDDSVLGKLKRKLSGSSGDEASHHHEHDTKACNHQRDSQRLPGVQQHTGNASSHQEHSENSVQPDQHGSAHQQAGMSHDEHSKQPHRSDQQATGASWSSPQGTATSPDGQQEWQQQPAGLNEQQHQHPALPHHQRRSLLHMQDDHQTKGLLNSGQEQDHDRHTFSSNQPDGLAQHARQAQQLSHAKGQEQGQLQSPQQPSNAQGQGQSSGQVEQPQQPSQAQGQGQRLGQVQQPHQLSHAPDQAHQHSQQSAPDDALDHDLDQQNHQDQARDHPQHQAPECSDDLRQYSQPDRDQLLQQAEEEDEEYYRQAGLQKPKRPTENDMDSGSTWNLKQYKHRRHKKKTLHESLVNPTDLFWDAVWIEPEDIIREGLLVSPKMTEDHYTTSLLRSLKAVSERLASQEGKAGKDTTQGSTQVTAADKDSGENGSGSFRKSKNESGGMKEAALGGVFDLV